MKTERLFWSKAITSCERRYPYLLRSFLALVLWAVLGLLAWVAIG